MTFNLPHQTKHLAGKTLLSGLNANAGRTLDTARTQEGLPEFRADGEVPPRDTRVTLPSPSMFMSPTSVWVIVVKDREGKPRGFEKTLNGRVFMDEVEAQSRFDSMEQWAKDSYMVQEAVIMSRATFDRKCGANPFV